MRWIHQGTVYSELIASNGRNTSVSLRSLCAFLILGCVLEGTRSHSRVKANPVHFRCLWFLISKTDTIVQVDRHTLMWLWVLMHDVLSWIKYTQKRWEMDVVSILLALNIYSHPHENHVFKHTIETTFRKNLNILPFLLITSHILPSPGSKCLS